MSAAQDRLIVLALGDAAEAVRDRSYGIRDDIAGLRRHFAKRGLLIVAEQDLLAALHDVGGIPANDEACHDAGVYGNLTRPYELAARLWDALKPKDLRR